VEAILLHGTALAALEEEKGSLGQLPGFTGWMSEHN